MLRKLKPKQVNAARLLATGLSGVEVARRLKLRPETLSRWKQIAAFRKEIEYVMQDTHEALRFKLTHLAEASVSAVWSELHNYSHDSKRLTAALNVIKLLGIEQVVDSYEALAEPSEATSPAIVSSRTYVLARKIKERQAVSQEANERLNSLFRIASTSSMETLTPSAANEVTPNVSMPQGIMPE